MTLNGVNIIVELTLAYLGTVGAASSYYISCKLKEVSDMTDDVGAELAGWGFMLMGFGLLIETIVHLLHLYKMLYGTAILIPSFLYVHGNAFSPLPPVLFLVAYTLYFAGAYVSHRLSGLTLAITPISVLILFLGEMNTLMLLELFLAFIYSFENKNKKFLTFFSILLLSHLIIMLGILMHNMIFAFIRIAFALRALAPTILVYMVIRKKR